MAQLTDSPLYRFESDPCILLNLQTPDIETLKAQQQSIQKQIARLTVDLTVITDAVIASGQEVE